MYMTHVAQCSNDTIAVADHRGPRPLLPEGVLSQRLHQELEAARTFLQHTRYQLCLPGHIWTLPGRNDREGDLLADERSAEQSRHDDGYARLDRYGGEPNRCLPGNTHRRFHGPFPQQ